MNAGQISVIMAVYNCQDTVRQAIDSILEQTYTNWQFIICDDCSTDGTLEIVQEYSEVHPGKFLVIRNERNSRLAYSLNHCLEFAEGEYCARMDGDDYVAPERFEKQVAYLQSHPEAQLVGTWMQTFSDKGLGRVVRYKEFPEKIDLRRGPCFAHATIMTYTYVYKELGGYTVSARTARTQDYDLWFRFFSHGFRGANLQEPLYYVREDDKAFMRRKPQLYLWAVITRAKGFYSVNMPLRYYPWVISPLVSLAGNEVRKARVRLLKRAHK